MNLQQLEAKGIKVDVEKLGQGIYDMIIETGNAAVLSYGMFPADIMESLERNVDEKIISLAAEKLCLSADEARPYLNKEKLKEYTKPIIHAVTVKVLEIASKEKLLLV